MPLVDEDAKRAILRAIPYALFLVGVRANVVVDANKDLSVFVGSWVGQCSFKPPMVSLAVRRGTRSAELIADSKVFVLNVVGPDQKETALSFLRSVTVDEGRINGLGFRTGATGAPILDALPAYLECEVERIVDGPGDHLLVMARVVEAGRDADFDAGLSTGAAGWSYAG